MGIKLEERGRGKFKPALDYNADEVKRILLEKISEEKDNIVENQSDFKQEEIKYSNEHMNIISLFSGAGGLDLGFELAGLAAAIGDKEALETFKNKEKFNSIRHNSVFKTIYTNDIFQEAIETYMNNNGDNVYSQKKDIRKVKEFPAANIVLGGFPCLVLVKQDHD
ncbi:DNA-cytosine methyltransferase [Bacillus sp. JCM 19045]|nr:DNA-cytosine methyltransferase [Bacillus sp. JCM 19045]